MEYIVPKSIEEIAERVSERKAYYLAGGTDIMAMKKDDLLIDYWPIVDLSHFGVLKGITQEEDRINIGPLCTMTEIAENELIIEKAKALSEATGTMGSPLIRNLATIGGNLANSNPAADTIPGLCALDAVVVLQKGARVREIPVIDSCIGPCENALEAGEIITRIKIPVSDNGVSSFRKLGARQALAISKVSVAVWYVLEKSKIQDIRIAMGAVGPRCLRARKSEVILKGQTLNRENAKIASEAIPFETSAIDDFRSTKDYREKMAGVLLRRILWK